MFHCILVDTITVCKFINPYDKIIRERIQEFSSGGGPGQSDIKALKMFLFFSPQLILQKSNGQFQRNPSFFQVSRGCPTFSRGGGGPTFSRGGGGVQLLIPIETHITCDFPGGVRTPCPPPPPLDLHLITL